MKKIEKDKDLKNFSAKTNHVGKITSKLDYL
jgi:hypothetical protein